MSGVPRELRFIRRLFDQGGRYIDEMIQENQRLEQEVLRLTELLGSTHDLHEQELARSTQIARERDALRTRADSLRLELDHTTTENAELASRCVDAETRLAALSGLYVISSELHASLDLADVLQTIEEIVINLLGCESYAIYLADPHQRQLSAASAMDLPPLAPKQLEVGHGQLGRAALLQDPWTETAAPSAGDARVVVPLRVRDRLVGLIAIFGFLSHKKGVTDVDRELLKLLSSQAATALQGASMYGREVRRAATFEGLLGLMRSSSQTPAEGG